MLVTGSTSGTGREAALALGRLGARVLVHGRDCERGEATVDAASVDSLDILVNNAGGMFRDAGTTAEGIEYTIAMNHLAPFC